MVLKDKISLIKDYATVVAIGTGVALVVLCAVMWGTSVVRDMMARKDARQYETSRDWSVDLKPFLGTQLVAKTKVVDGRLMGTVTLDGYPTPVADIKGGRPASSNLAISLSFLDADGFNVFEKFLDLNDLNSAVDSSSKKPVLRYQFENFISVDSYKRFSQLSVQWSSDPDGLSDNHAGADAKPLDPCAADLSKADRLKRLAQYGKVRRASSGDYTAGARSLNLADDGSLLSCR